MQKESVWKTGYVTYLVNLFKRHEKSLINEQFNEHLKTKANTAESFVGECFSVLDFLWFSRQANRRSRVFTGMHALQSRIYNLRVRRHANLRERLKT